MKKITLVAVVILFLAGCHKLVGGGWFYGLSGEKVHFAFQAQCVEDYDVDGNIYDVYHEGQLQFMDKENDVRFHGDINWQAGFGGDRSCDDPVGDTPYNVGEFSGVCLTQPDKLPGTFSVHVEDNGTAGPNAGDFLSITTNCTADGSLYYNEGLLRGGNILSLGHKN